MFIEKCKELILESIPNKLPNNSGVLTKLLELLQVIVDNCPSIYRDELCQFTNSEIRKRRDNINGYNHQ